MALKRAASAAWSSLTRMVAGGTGAGGESIAKATAGIDLQRSSAAARLDEALAQLASVKAPSPADKPQPSVPTPSKGSAVDSAAALKELVKDKSPAEIGALASAYFHGTAFVPHPVGGDKAGKRAAKPAGPALTKDQALATKLWVLASRKGDAASLFNVALCLIDGCGALPKDKPAAIKILSQLADGAGHAWSAFVLGSLLIAQQVEAAFPGTVSSLAVDPSRIPAEQRSHPDCVRGFKYLLAASQAGVGPSWLNTSNCYEHGVGTPPDEQQAVAWLQKAALAGDPLAAGNLAARYATGKGGVPKEPRMAQRLWRSAAEAGHPVAAHNIGVGYLTADQGKSFDYAAAFVWFSRAGDAGYLRSQVNAGAILATGADGVTQDKQAARRWFEKARGNIQGAIDSARQNGLPDSSPRLSFLLGQLEDVTLRLAELDGNSFAAAGDTIKAAAPNVLIDTPPEFDSADDASLDSLKQKSSLQLSASNLLEKGRIKVDDIEAGVSESGKPAAKAKR